MYSCSSCALLTRPPIFEVEIEMHDDLSPMLVVSQAHDPFSVRVKMCTFSPLTRAKPFAKYQHISGRRRSVVDFRGNYVLAYAHEKLRKSA